MPIVINVEPLFLILNAGFGTLSISQRRGVISLIPKDENNLTKSSNWRPITLLNVDYKILAKVTAKRIEPVFPILIHPDQTGFIKGRFIGQNIRLLNDLIEFTDDQRVPGIPLFIDFEKAFDSIEWTFIQNVLILNALILVLSLENGSQNSIRT